MVGIIQLTVKKILAELNRFQERKVNLVLGMFIKIQDDPVAVMTPAYAFLPLRLKCCVIGFNQPL